MDFYFDAQNWLIGLPWLDIGIAILIFLFVFFMRKIFTRYIFRVILNLARMTPTSIFTNILIAFEKPIRFFIGILGIYLALLYLPFPRAELGFINTIYRSLIIFVIGWGFFNFVAVNSTVFSRMTRNMEDGENSMLVPFISRLSRFVIVALTVTVILIEWEYDITGFIAGLGLGGLAFALAAQDTLSNFLGGVIIVTERPFKKGDWIETPTVEGIVQDISFRSTKVRTFSDSLVTVPNKTLAHEAITNWSEINKREISFKLSVEYGTPRDQLDNVVKRINWLLRSHEGIDQEIIIVKFSEFNESSLDIFLYFFTKTTAWLSWFDIKEEINYEILKILEEEGVDVAFPSKSIYFEEMPKEFVENFVDEMDKVKSKKQESLAGSSYNDTNDS
ncbi:mechanosensitive ion channel family protein [Alteribacillus sp. HJP-4]|uniref:mechanosensitive ion channel family protein n=1 Tax=Alteribacillus sp. HJP-4 TaxID=2775394 RepID=UPI0035CCE58F